MTSIQGYHHAEIPVMCGPNLRESDRFSKFFGFVANGHGSMSEGLSKKMFAHLIHIFKNIFDYIS